MRKQTILDHIQVYRDGQILLRFAKQVVDDDGTILSNQWVRTSLAPGQDAEAHLDVINAAVDGFAPLETADRQFVSDVKGTVDTVERVADFEAKKADLAIKNRP